MAKLTPKHYAMAWYEALIDTPKKYWSEISKRFLNVIYRSGHLRWLPEIVRQFEEHEYAQQQVQPVTVTLARALDTTTIQEYIKQLLPNDRLVITTLIQNPLIGGLVVETRDQRWNLSINGQLRNLAHSLKG